MSSRYTIRLSAAAEAAISYELPEKIATAALEFIYGPLAENPHRVGKLLREPLAGYHVARRGTYRVIYEIIDSEIIVDVVLISHRRDAYHRR